LVQATQFLAQLLLALVGLQPFTRPVPLLLQAFMQLVPQTVQVTLQPM
jgi:hypothetical protein